jgi:hypothetical protein
LTKLSIAVKAIVFSSKPWTMSSFWGQTLKFKFQIKYVDISLNTLIILSFNLKTLHSAFFLFIFCDILYFTNIHFMFFSLLQDSCSFVGRIKRIRQQNEIHVTIFTKVWRCFCHLYNLQFILSFMDLYWTKIITKTTIHIYNFLLNNKTFILIFSSFQLHYFSGQMNRKGSKGRRWCLAVALPHTSKTDRIMTAKERRKKKAWKIS